VIEIEAIPMPENELESVQQNEVVNYAC